MVHPATPGRWKSTASTWFCLRILLYPRLRNRLDPSDVAQETVLKAQKAIIQFRGTTDVAKRAWLRKILIRTINAEYRRLDPEWRDVNVERSLEDGLQQSSRDWSNG